MSERPLAGYRVLVTRPTRQADALVAAIRDSGGDAILFPVMKIVGRSPDVIAREFSGMPAPDIVVFVSRNAVDYGLSVVQDSGALFAAVGPATSAAIEAAGLDVAISPGDGFDSEHLLRHPALQAVAGKTVIIVRGERGREHMAETLKSRGADVHYLSTYRREIRLAAEDELASLCNMIADGGIDCITVMSVESLRNLLQQLPPDTLAALRRTPLVAPGDRVIQTVVEMIPGSRAIAASGPQPADMVNALIEMRRSGQNS